MRQYLWLVFVLILIYLLIQEKAKTGQVINALSGFNIKTIQALQGSYA